MLDEALELLACPRCGGALRGPSLSCARCGVAYEVRGGIPDLRLAAVTHVDGTARVQVVDRAMAPRFHALLEEVGRRCGVPVLLNTSFNLAGEPIVARAAEAYSTFRRSGIDLLACGPVLVAKRRASDSRAREAVA